MFKKITRRIIFIFITTALLLGVLAIGVNIYVKSSVDERIVDSVSTEEQYDCIIILGCGVRPDGTPSSMLTDRLNKGIELYKSGAAPVILMSGDHGTTQYDEVSVMKQFAIDNGVPSDKIFLDHAGFSSYESIYRAKEIFGVKKAIFVTQEYHLYRTLFVAQNFGIESIGCPAQKVRYTGQTIRDAREVIARSKDFLYCLFEPKPTYLGEKISLSDNGDITN